MNKSPDRSNQPKSWETQNIPLTDPHFESDLAEEHRLQTLADLKDDSELSADRALKEALAQLPPPTISDELKQKILNQTQPDRPASGWWAMAAAVVLSVLVVMSLDPLAERGTPSDLSAQDWAELQLAFQTLNAQGTHIAQVTRREVNPHLSLPTFELPSMQLDLDPLPYPNSFRRWFQPSIPQSQ